MAGSRRKTTNASLQQRTMVAMILACMATMLASTLSITNGIINAERSRALEETQLSARWRLQAISESGQSGLSEALSRALVTPIGRERLVWLDINNKPILDYDQELTISSDGKQAIEATEGRRSYIGALVDVPRDARNAAGQSLYLLNADLMNMANIQALPTGKSLDDALKAPPPNIKRQKISEIIPARLLVLQPDSLIFLMRARTAISVILGSLIGIVTALALSLLLSRQTLKEVEELKEEAEKISRTPKGKATPLEIQGSPEIQQVRNTINRLTSHLRESIENQDAFLSDVSHELRSPITAIDGHAGLILRRHQISEQSRESLEVIQRESRRMARLVGDLMDLQRINHSWTSEKSSPEEINLKEIAEEACQATAEWQKNIHITGQARIKGHRDRLKQVLVNTISNARNAGASQINISLTQTRIGATIEIADDGKGLAPEEAERIFERFYRSDASRARNTGGSGLGLAISAAIIRELHQGNIRIVSPGINQGARIIIDLPRDIARSVHSNTDNKNIDYADDRQIS